MKTIVSDQSDKLQQYKALTKKRIEALQLYFKDIKKSIRFVKGSMEEYSYDIEFTREQLIELKGKA